MPSLVNALKAAARRALQAVGCLERVRRFRGQLRTRPEAYAAQQERLRRFYSQFLGPGDLCFDVGAHVGERTAIFLDLGAKVVAFEPNPACAAEINRRLGRQDRLVIERQALGAAPGEGELFLDIGASTLSSMSAEWIESVRSSGRFGGHAWQDSSITIQVTTLDEAIARHGRPAFCKIDVEGFEPEVLKGLSRPIPAVSFEFTPECTDRARTSAALLDALGQYEYNYSEGKGMEWAWPEWLPAGELFSRLAEHGLRLADGKYEFGDIYARLSDRAGAQG